MLHLVLFDTFCIICTITLCGRTILAIEQHEECNTDSKASKDIIDNIKNIDNTDNKDGKENKDNKEAKGN